MARVIETDWGPLLGVALEEKSSEKWLLVCVCGQQT